MNSPHFNLENFTSVLFSTNEVERSEDKELREKTFTWKNSLLFSIEQERLSLLRTLMRNGFDVKDLNFTKLRRVIEDKLFYLWVNFFKLGGDHIGEELSSFSIDKGVDLAEFNDYDIRQAFDKRREDIEGRLKRAKTESERGLITKELNDLNNEMFDYYNKRAGESGTQRIRRTRLETKIKKRQLKESDKTLNETGVSFLEETDFGRVYLLQRVNYIGNVYVGDEKKQMEDLVKRLQDKEEFKKGKISQPLTEYFERGVRYKNNKLIDNSGEYIKARRTQTVNVNNQEVKIAGQRLSEPERNLSNIAERELLGELRKLFGNNDNKVRRIAETEISAAYNLGRIHAMYNRGETLVRWINDRENTLSGKVCQICLSIAMGRTTKPQVKDLIPPDLSGVYTLDEVLTERQLAIPVHPYCSCYVRPLTDAEKSRIGAIPEGLGEIVTSAIATVGAMGTDSINVQENEKRANQWWGSSFVKNAALIGAGVVTMSAALFWMRKSLGNRGAAELLKRKGAQMAKDIDNLRLGPKQKQILRQGDLPKQITGRTDVPSDTPITQKSVDESLVIKEGIDTPIEEQGQPLPELLSRLPRLEEPERVLVENAYTRQATYGVAAEIGVVQLGDVKNASTGDLSLVKDQLQGQIKLVESSIKQVQLDKFNASDEVQQSLDLVGNLGNDTLKTLKSSYERVEKELVKRGEDVVYIKPKPLSTFESEAQRYGEIVDVRLKKIETMTKRIDDILEGLERRGDSRWEYKRHKEETTRTARLSGELGDIQKELAESNISLLGEYAKRISQMDYWDNNPDMKRMIGEVQEKVAKLEKASESLSRMQNKLFDLEQVVPTYIEKIKRGKKDRFIKQDDLKDVVMRDDKGKLTDVNKELSKTLKLSGIKEREKLIAQLDKWLGQSDVKTPFSGGLNPEIRKVLSRLGEDYDMFMGLNNRQMKDRMRGIVKELSSEIKRLKYSEFRRYQQKWMAEFNNN